MAIDQTQIQNLVSRPAEGLNVETKRWIDPDEDTGIAKIVRACLAIRNPDGAFVVFGFDNKTLQPDLAHEPANAQTAFHVGTIQGIVSRYCSEPFEIAIGFGTRDGHQYPVPVTPQGIITPVAAKADLIKSGPSCAGAQLLSLSQKIGREPGSRESLNRFLSGVRSMADNGREARWLAEFEQLGYRDIRDTLRHVPTGWEEARRQCAFRWLREKEKERDQLEARSRQDTRRTLIAAVLAGIISALALIVSIIAIFRP